MDKSKLMPAIDVRCSRRKYLGSSIDPMIVSKLKEIIEECNQATGIRLELVLNNGKAFQGITKSYGIFSGVNDYICLLADKDDATAVERLGYYGELVVLHATALEISSCWVGGTRSGMPFPLAENEMVVCTIVIGNTKDERSLKERLMHKATHRKTKSAEDMFTSDASVPDWFMNGMKAVQKAPSAVNRQPVMFSYKDGKVSASVKDISNTSQALDFGIAKLHFEIGSGGGEWIWGNNGEFYRSS